MTNKTVTMSRELAEKLALPVIDGEKLLPDRFQARAELASLLAAPVVERQEPVAEVDRLYQGYLKWTAWGQLESPRLPDGTKLYTSPPAPVAADELQAIQDRHEAWMGGVENGKASVAVVLPERRDNYPDTNAEWYQAHGWNACLDKVKELNQ
jgi:hypothetical protein